MEKQIHPAEAKDNQTINCNSDSREHWPVCPVAGVIHPEASLLRDYQANHYLDM
jgi:hypothetical protein